MKTIGVIGLGSIGMRHAKNLLALGHTVWGFDPDDQRGMELVSSGGFTIEFSYGDMSVVTDRFSDMCETFDGVVIASPTHLHHDQIAIADYKKTKIFCEKPITHAGLHEAINLSNIIMVGYNLRFHSCVKQAKEWLDAGLIGQPIWANFTLSQYSDKPPYLRDGVILNWSHEIDLCLYLLGEAEISTSATRVCGGKDDMTDILLTHKNGCRSSIHLDYLTKPEIRQGIIIGDRGQIVFDLVNRTAWIRIDGEFKKAIERKDTWNNNYIEEMQAFIDRIDGKETLGCTAEEALKVLDICLQVRKQAGLE